jgi:hypothetical protein
MTGSCVEKIEELEQKEDLAETTKESEKQVAV